MKPTLTPGSPQHQQLHQLSRDINAHRETIDMLREKTVGTASEWLTEVILCGEKLNKARAIVKHGDWMDWLKFNCPLISHDSARRYMLVASNSARVRNSDVDSLRVAVALLAEKNHGAGGSDGPRLPPYLEALGRVHKLIGFLDRRREREDAPLLLGWPDEGREKLREDLEPVARELWPDRFD